MREQEPLVAEQRQARVGRAALGGLEDVAHLVEVGVVVAGDPRGRGGGEQSPQAQHQQQHARADGGPDGPAGIVAHHFEQLLVAIVHVVEQPPTEQA